VTLLKTISFYLEPVGTRAPKLTQIDSNFKVATREAGLDIAVLCQAQAFPVPTFRYTLILSYLANRIAFIM